MSDLADAPWISEESIGEHFRVHSRAMGHRSVQEYDASAHDTIRIGEPFNYRDRSTDYPRFGFYHLPTRRFTVVDGGDEVIVTHFTSDEAYVRDLPESTYLR